MGDLNFDPLVGEEVRVPGRPGVFSIANVYPPGTEHPIPGLRTSEGLSGTVDLKRLDDGFGLPAIPWHRLTFVDETRSIRHFIEWLKTNPEGHPFPDYVVGHEVNAGTDHAGNPAVFVLFLVDPAYFYEHGRASEEKVAALNDFLDDVRDELLSLDSDRWIYVRASEARRALDVAS